MEVLKCLCMCFVVVGVTAGYLDETDKELLDDLNKVVDSPVLKRISKVLQAGWITCQDDKTVAAVCPLWKNAQACRYQRAWMRQYCARTCDLCTPPAPPLPEVPPCAKTQFGCCWDNTTVAQGPATDIRLSQCSPCLDMQSSRFCTYWKSDCHNQIEGQGDVMRRKCPKTCQVPCENNLNIHKTTCQDDKAYKQECLQWFDEGKCQTDQQTMRLYCPFSCGYCHKVTQVSGFNES